MSEAEDSFARSQIRKLKNLVEDLEAKIKRLDDRIQQLERRAD